MRNKLIYIWVAALAPAVAVAQDAASDSTAAADSALKAAPHSGPLGMDDTTGLILYIIAILFLMLSLLLWRKRLQKAS